MELLADVAIATQEERNVFDSYDGSSQDTVILNGNVVPVVPEGGNTITPSGTGRRQVSPAKRWYFTYNNPDETTLVPMFQKFQGLCSKYVAAHKIGENNTPHIQGAIELKKKARPMSLGFDPRIHWEKTKGTWEQNYEYCTKEDGEK